MQTPYFFRSCFLQFAFPIAHDVLVSECHNTDVDLLLSVLATQVGHFACRQALFGFSQIDPISYSLCTQIFITCILHYQLRGRVSLFRI